MADIQKRVSVLFSSFTAKLAFSLDQAKDLFIQSSYLDLLNLPYRQGLGLGLFKVEPVCHISGVKTAPLWASLA